MFHLIRFVMPFLCLFDTMSRVLLFCLIVMFMESSHGMTQAQVKKAMGIVKNQCMQKNGVTDDQVGRIEQGAFTENHDVMCYITCIYKNLQVLKNNKLDYDLIAKQIDLLYPQDLKEPVKKSVAGCVHLQDKYSDMCEGVFYASRCLYEKDPAAFIFP